MAKIKIELLFSKRLAYVQRGCRVVFMILLFIFKNYKTLPISFNQIFEFIYKNIIKTLWYQTVETLRIKKCIDIYMYVKEKYTQH